MTKKRIIAMMLALTMVLTLFTGCGNSNAESGMKYYGDKINKKTLRICIDTEHVNGSIPDNLNPKTIYYDFIQQVKSAAGIDRVSIEILPGEGAERETALQRMRTEIMSGGGPDVFIFAAVGNDGPYEAASALLNFPGKNMEAGLFLPLDEYMANNTQFTDWSNQTKAVMDAGRSDEGQVIIPLTYTFPVIVYPENEVKLEHSPTLTMREILDDPETAELGAVMYGSISGTEHEFKLNYIPYELGQLADYEKEELLFTEDELYERLNEMFPLYETALTNEQQYITEDLGRFLFYEISVVYFDEEMTLVPLYSKNGGVTASIMSYAAVNRNTRFPEEAYTVIDLFLSEKMQSKSDLYSWLLLSGIPMQHDLGQEGKPLVTGDFLEQAHFEDLQMIKGQITSVNFRSELDLILEQLVNDYFFEYFTTGEISHEMVSEAYATMKRMMGE